MKTKKNNKILLIMPPFWDPICPPQGIVSLKAYLDNRGYEVHIVDLNTDGNLFKLQQKHFELATSNFPQWKFLNIPRNGPRYFARHQLVWFYSLQRTSKYKELIRHILNFDGKSICSDQMIDQLDSIINQIFNIVAVKTQELMELVNPDIVGCTMLESTFPSALAILKKVKEINPKTVTVLGGPGIVTGNMVDDGNLQRISEKCDWIDAIIYGEGERVLEGYLEGSFGDRKILTIQDLENDTSLKPAPHVLLDIKDIPMPTYDGLPAIKYLWLSVFSSRGCPFKCTFCYEKDYWVRFRKKTVEQVINEMKALSARYGKNKLFYLCDSLANHIATPLSKAILSKKEKLRWDCYMRITTECLDEEKVKLWARGGMERARIGVESGSPRVLGLMNKDISTEQITTGLSNFAGSGICTSTLWIAGFPGEREEDFRESLRFLEENSRNIYQADIWEFISSPKKLSPSEDTGVDFATKPLYPEEFDDLLLIKYYDQESEGLAPERFDKISQFEELRMKLGVPNPYTLKELLEANKRWVKLGHKKR
ncbi:MAG: radical SAM protein [Nitrospirae bacterium]|nr:radical SAM protein [Nitrospirota bacterium]